jgi:transcriptional antiterminator RfaH
VHIPRTFPTLGDISDESAQSPDGSGQWFVAKVKPGLEAQVVQVLMHRQVNSFLPRIPARPRTGPGGRVTEPLFPGYLFTQFDPTTNEWIQARSAPGVQYLLPKGMSPLAVDPELVAEIRFRCEARLHEGWKPAFRKGDYVLVEHGPFRGFAGVFDGSLSSKGRVRVLLELVSRQTPVELDGNTIRHTPRRDSAPGALRRTA